MRKTPSVRFRVDLNGNCSVGIGKVELLEAIARTGSLSQAAREIGMSYRRAWLLLADMNIHFGLPVARTSTGGRGGGGAALTGFGASIVSGYRMLESGMRPLAKSYLRDLNKHLIASRANPIVNTSSIRRKPTLPPRRRANSTKPR